MRTQKMVERINSALQHLYLQTAAIQAMLKPNIMATATMLTDSAHARYVVLQHKWAAAGAKLVQSIRGSKGDQAAFAGNLAALAAQLAENDTFIPDLYTFAYMAEFSEAILWSQRLSPIAAPQRTDMDESHQTTNVRLYPFDAPI